MGKGPRAGISTINNTPGPGSYLQKGKIGEGPKFGMRPKTAVVMKQFVPGPGQYSPSRDAVQIKTPGVVMGGGSRKADLGGAAKGVPGPGAYTQSSPSKGGPAFSFGSAGGVANKKSEVPGPGTYNMPSSISNLPEYAMRKV
jgi:hypothetical protein